MSHEYTIKPNRSWFKIEWREIWAYRDLLTLLVRRDFVAKYKQTVLGPIWFIFQPLVMTVVFTIIFNRVAKLSTDNLPPVLFYMSGLLAWNYFSQSFNSITTTFRSNANLFGKVYFPRLVVPLGFLLSGLIAAALQLAAFLVIFGYFKLFSDASATFAIRGVIIFFPLLVIQTACLALGVGLLFASLTAKYRDLVHALQFITQVWMYATPIIYPTTAIAEQYRWLLALNPMTSVVESTRLIFLGQGTLTPLILTSSVIFTLVIMVSGILIFNRVQRTFVDTV